MFHKIYHMYSGIKNTDKTNMGLLITSMSDNKYMNKVSETKLNSHENHQN